MPFGDVKIIDVQSRSYTRWELAFPGQGQYIQTFPSKNQRVRFQQDGRLVSRTVCIRTSTPYDDSTIYQLHVTYNSIVCLQHKHPTILHPNQITLTAIVVQG